MTEWGDKNQWLSPGIIEVLDQTPSIEFSNLTTFKTKAPYWGTRYGLSNLPTLTLKQLFSVGR